MAGNSKIKGREKQRQRTEPATAPGTWASDGRHYLRVAAADGWLDLLDVQLEGKKRMSVEELLRGFKPNF